jgi:hypothetical protein
MRKRLKNIYQCLVSGCTEQGLVKTVVLDANDQRLFTQPTFICLCGWEPKLIDSQIITVKADHDFGHVLMDAQG